MFLANKIGGSRGGEGKSPFGYELMIDTISVRLLAERAEGKSRIICIDRTGLLKIDVQRRYVAFGVF